MQYQPIQIVSFHCVLKNKLGRVISSTFNHEVMTHDPSQPEILSGLAEGLKDLRKGEKRQIVLTAEKAYGFYDIRKVVTRNREDLPFDRTPRLGETVTIKTVGGRVETYRITNVTADTVTLDANHPLAGQDLIFEIEALQVRAATDEEISSSVHPFSEEVFH